MEWGGRSFTEVGWWGWGATGGGGGWGLNLEMEGSVEALTPLLVSCGPPCTHSLAAVREVRVETICPLSTQHCTTHHVYATENDNNQINIAPSNHDCIAGNTLQCIGVFLLQGNLKPNVMICQQTALCFFDSPDEHGVLWFVSFCLFVC